MVDGQIVGVYVRTYRVKREFVIERFTQAGIKRPAF